ncbi:DUF2272 domain-containing protein [Elioraea sp. Yellowstone]|jgi:hypothetical protein|uniref:DUF2272 domain-containing protein n=1 Tax=Elioraea sp. Yellowstone TaxID=2592070 RepID=UPI00114EBD82|nr:DUF2272 domain-containing protein [Elioraea sp. Yellowstone]TQF76439.1 DUF2272 domain-containing protein [Elioraea sp. Yellowstone]
MDTVAERLAAWAEAEEARFLGRLEDEAPCSGWIAEYWRIVGDAAGRPHYRHVDGRTVDAEGERWAWSAAFVGAGVWAATGGAEWFAYCEWHSTYVRDAMRRAAAGGDQPYRAFPIDALPPRRGDLVVQWRAGIGDGAPDRPVTWRTAPRLDPFTSHGDIVVRVADGVAEIVGGNLADTVQRRRLALGPDGRLRDTAQARGHWFALIRFA